MASSPPPRHRWDENTASASSGAETGIEVTAECPDEQRRPPFRGVGVDPCSRSKMDASQMHQDHEVRFAPPQDNTSSMPGDIEEHPDPEGEGRARAETKSLTLFTQRVVETLDALALDEVCRSLVGLHEEVRPDPPIGHGRSARLRTGDLVHARPVTRIWSRRPRHHRSDPDLRNRAIRSLSERSRSPARARPSARALRDVAVAACSQSTTAP
jgi:hypothetical protein